MVHPELDAAIQLTIDCRQKKPLRRLFAPPAWVGDVVAVSQIDRFHVVMATSTNTSRETAANTMTTLQLFDVRYLESRYTVSFPRDKVYGCDKKRRNAAVVSSHTLAAQQESLWGIEITKAPDNRLLIKQLIHDGRHPVSFSGHEVLRKFEVWDWTKSEPEHVVTDKGTLGECEGMSICDHSLAYLSDGKVELCDWRSCLRRRHKRKRLDQEVPEGNSVSPYVDQDERLHSFSSVAWNSTGTCMSATASQYVYTWQV